MRWVGKLRRVENDQPVQLKIVLKGQQKITEA